MPTTSFNDLWGDWLFYVCVDGPIVTVFFLVPAVIVLLLFSMLRGELSKFVSRLIGLGVLLAILLPIGGIFYVLWAHLIFGNLYVTASPDSPDEDFSPFSPVDSKWLNMQHGHSLVSMWRLYLVWLGFAGAAWLISCLLYKVLAHNLPWRIRVPFVQA